MFYSKVVPFLVLPSIYHTKLGGLIEIEEYFGKKDNFDE